MSCSWVAPITHAMRTCLGSGQRSQQGLSATGLLVHVILIITETYVYIYYPL